MWALLALFTVWTAPIPPFQLNAMTFAVGGGLGLFWLVSTGGLGQLRGIGWPVYAFGTLGLFGYHALYFSALRLAPAAEASLIAYLWPLFIVLFSGLLPGERLRLLHVLGAVMAFAGAALVVWQGSLTGGAGLVLAFLCALVWAGYSVISRRMGDVPTAAVVVFCLATAVLSAPAHLAFETTVVPTATNWLAVLALGLGPVGAAFFVWDVGMKRGDIQLLGVASYAAPLLSVLALIAAGIAPARPVLGLSALLIMGGAALAARASVVASAGPRR
jgi:drug/metabolite transporter (DMT)-like permease